MFSPLSYKNSRIMLGPLEAEAVYYLPKSLDEIRTEYAKLSAKLIVRIWTVVGAGIALRLTPFSVCERSASTKASGLGDF